MSNNGLEININHKSINAFITKLQSNYSIMASILEELKKQNDALSLNFTGDSKVGFDKISDKLEETLQERINKLLCIIEQVDDSNNISLDVDIELGKNMTVE